MNLLCDHVRSLLKGHARRRKVEDLYATATEQVRDVVLGAAVVAVVPPLLGAGAVADWLYRALVLLVIACPCALVISTPVAIVSALTAASRRGVLVKGGAHLEALGAVATVAFDKTGTLTGGRLEVTDVLAASGHAEAEVLGIAAGLEADVGHPVGEAIVEAACRAGLARRPRSPRH